MGPLYIGSVVSNFRYTMYIYIADVHRRYRPDTQPSKIHRIDHKSACRRRQKGETHPRGGVRIWADTKPRGQMSQNLTVHARASARPISSLTGPPCPGSREQAAVPPSRQSFLPQCSRPPLSPPVGKIRSRTPHHHENTQERVA